MIRIDLPADHPAAFIVEEVKQKLAGLEAKHGKPIVIQVVVAHSLFKMLSMIEELSDAVEGDERGKARAQHEAAERIFESAMSNLTHDLDEKGDAIVLSAVRGIMHAEQAINAINALAGVMPADVTNGLMDSIKKAVDATKAANAAQKAPEAPAGGCANAH